MSDQQAPPEQGTPAVAGPAEAPGTQEQGQHGTPEVDWQKRALDHQAAFTQAAQERAELAQWKEWAELAFNTDDPDTQRQALERLGIDIPGEVEDVEPAEYEDPYDEIRNELNELREWKEQSTQRQQEEMGQQYFDSHMEREIERLGLDQLEDHQYRTVLLLSGGMTVPAPPGAPVQELPNLEAAYEQWKQDMLTEQKSWAKTKRAPYVPSGGLPANEAPNPGTGHDARMDRALRSLQDSEAIE